MLSCIAMLLFFTVRVVAQDDYNERAKKYIEQYSRLAISEQQRCGIPACITLGQGILETEAGNSELMTEANNHFGIKCKNGWTGETFLHTDDAKDECFKKYKCAEDSYKDHSTHLKINPRYSSLFSLSMTDYAAWAKGLKRCGYATDPQYAPRLIKIIEDFDLQQYTYAAMDSSKNVAAVIKQQTPAAPNPTLVDVIEDTTKWIIDKKRADAEKKRNASAAVDSTKKIRVVYDTLVSNKTETDPLRKVADSARSFILHSDPIVPVTDFDSTEIVKINGLKAFYAHKGDMLLQYAMKYNVRYSKLLEINDLADGPLPDNSCIYLEKKLSTGVNATHSVAYGETLWLISQKEGMQLKRLTALNLLSADDVPATGAVLQLQFPAAKKPDVMITPSTAHKSNSIIIITSDDKAAAASAHDSDYIALKKPIETASAITDSEFIHTTDTTIIPNKTTATHTKPAAFPKARPTTPVVEGPPPIVVVTTKAPEDKNAPLHWVTTDTTAPVKKEALTEDEQQAKHEELANLKSQLDKVVYADDSKLITKIQNEQPVQKKPEEQAASKNVKYYTVKRGDTAFSISKRNNITVNQLYKWNDIDASDIKVGLKLKVSN